MLKPSEKHAFTDSEVEIEHLRKELAIIHKKALVIDDIKNQNETLQAQLEASYQTNEEQLNVNEK